MPYISNYQDIAQQSSPLPDDFKATQIIKGYKYTIHDFEGVLRERVEVEAATLGLFDTDYEARKYLYRKERGKMGVVEVEGTFGDRFGNQSIRKLVFSIKDINKYFVNIYKH